MGGGNEREKEIKEMKEESEKVGLKLNIQKTKIMASSPITSWRIDGETVETVADFIFGLQNHCIYNRPFNFILNIAVCACPSQAP